VPELELVASGLNFPEGPVAMPDGSVIVVEMLKTPRVTRVRPDGSTEVIADVPGGPNGAAIGPDNALYLCNNGGCFTPLELMGMLFPGPFDPEGYIGGRIQRLDLATGEIVDLYTQCGHHPLIAPNDLVLDAHGGMWFTDHGIRHERSSDRTGIYYAALDGSSITEVVHPVEAPNGIGLSPDGTKVYWAETHAGRVFQRTITAPGELAPAIPLDTSVCLCGLPGLQLLDSLAVDGAGNVCVATLVNGGITCISPEGEVLFHLPTGDPLTTNICFGGPDLRTAWITGGASGNLWRCEWPYPGLRLAHQELPTA
jgi:gluconolactonase